MKPPIGLALLCLTTTALRVPPALRPRRRRPLARRGSVQNARRGTRLLARSDDRAPARRATRRRSATIEEKEPMRELGVDAALQEEAAVLASKLGGDGELDEYFDVDDYLESLPEPEEEEAVDEEAEDCDVGAGQNACDSYLEGLTNWAYSGRSLSKPQGYEPETWFQNLLLSFGSRTFAAMRGRLVATALFAWVVAWAHSPHAALGPRAASRQLSSALAANAVLARFPVLRGCFVAGAALFRPLFTTLGLKHVKPIPIALHSLSGTVLGVLLAFRTSQSYDRFWAGRQLWADVANSVRNLGRLAAANCKPSRYEALLRLMQAYPVALRQHLRGQRDMDEFEPYLETSEVNELSTADNLPLALTLSMSVLLADLRTDPSPGGSYLWYSCNEQVTQLTEVIARSEAIAGTPVPISYSRHSSRVVSMFTLMLPLALVGIMDSVPGTVLSTTVISWFLFGIEVIGHNIEEPFGLGGVRRPELLPLRRYSENIILDLQEENRIIERALRSPDKEQEDAESAPAAAAESSAGTRIGVAGPVEVVGEEGSSAT